MFSYQNAFKLDPDNLDTLLALGISCTNTLDEVKAMNFLSIWMKNNKNYHSLNFNVFFRKKTVNFFFMLQTDIIPQNRLYDDFKIEEIKEMNANMLKMFQDARNLHPNDPELLVIQIKAMIRFIFVYLSKQNIKKIPSKMK